MQIDFVYIVCKTDRKYVQANNKINHNDLVNDFYATRKYKVTMNKLRDLCRAFVHQIWKRVNALGLNNTISRRIYLIPDEQAYLT